MKRLHQINQHCRNPILSNDQSHGKSRNRITSLLQVHKKENFSIMFNSFLNQLMCTKDQIIISMIVLKTILCIRNNLLHYHLVIMLNDLCKHIPKHIKQANSMPVVTHRQVSLLRDKKPIGHLSNPVELSHHYKQIQQVHQQFIKASLDHLRKDPITATSCVP